MLYEVITINELAQECGKEKWAHPEFPPAYFSVKEKLEKAFSAELSEAFKIKDKLDRQAKVAEIKEKSKASLGEENEEELAIFDAVFETMQSNVVRSAVIKTGIRIDGRDTKTVRPIECEVGVLPRAHGSALFTRGETQALVVATLGTGQDEQIKDDIYGESKEAYMLHYNFPSYSVGECGRNGSPGRREIGHGNRITSYNVCYTKLLR